MVVTREELERYLQRKGWHLDVVTRRQRGKLYAYAKRRQGARVITKYLCPEDQIETLDEMTVDRKLS